MDFQNTYFNINKFLLSLVGFWPYQARTEKFLCRTMLLIFWSGHFPFTTRRLINFWENEDDVIEIITIYFTFLLGIIKIANSVHKNSKMKQLLEKIDADWNIWSNKPELEILKNFANEGRIFTLIYAIALYLSVIFYSLFTLSPQLLDIFVPIPNETRAKKYLQPEYYGPNMENYFVIIFIYAAIGILINFTISASVDSMYVVYVQHACGIFSAIGQRLENIKFDCKSKDNKYSQEILFCLQQHKSILKYTEDLEETYTTYFFFLIIVNVLVLIVNGIQIVIKFDNFDDVFKFANYSILLVAHLFYNSIPGQKLLNYSVVVSHAAYNTCWYQATNSLKKSLLIMIMRSSKPCKISGGKFFILSLENFSVVMKTTLSYFTVLLSMRQ